MVNMYVGQRQRMVLSFDGATDSRPVFKSDNNLIAQVGPSGVAFGLSNGVCNISFEATAGGKDITGSFAVTVADPPPPPPPPIATKCTASFGGESLQATTTDIIPV